MSKKAAKKKAVKCPTSDDHEVVLHLASGYTLRSGVYDPGPDSFTCGEYVRLCDPNGEEILYWDEDEWRTDPALVMGAIINAAANPSVRLGPTKALRKKGKR